MEINNNNIRINSFTGANKMDKEPANFQEQVDGLIESLYKRAEREVSEYGDFSPVTEFIPNLDKGTASTVGKYGLKIYKMPKDIVPDEKKRYIEAAAYEPAGDYKSDMIVGSGNKKEVLEILKSEDFAKNLNNAYAELLEVMKDS